jgi:hypothetical protein
MDPRLRLLFQGETDLHGHLLLSDPAVVDGCACFHHLEPAQVADGLRGFGDGALNGTLDAGGGCAGL